MFIVDVPQDLWHGRMRIAGNIIMRHADYKSATFDLTIVFSGFYQGLLSIRMFDNSNRILCW